MNKSTKAFVIGVAAGVVLHYTWANMQNRPQSPTAG